MSGAADALDDALRAPSWGDVWPLLERWAAAERAVMAANESSGLNERINLKALQQDVTVARDALLAAVPDPKEQT